MFLTCGKFCNRTVAVELSHHPVKDCDDNIIVGKNLFCCYDCAVEEACHNPNVAGYLTQTDYKKYKEDAKRCFQFMKDGYIVLEQHEWRDWNMNKLDGDTLKNCWRVLQLVQTKTTKW